MLNSFERVALDRLRSIYGELTVDEALKLAIESEETARVCGPFDPAFTHFVTEQRNLEKMALLLEKKAIPAS